jgi:gas vesicle protein
MNVWRIVAGSLIGAVVGLAIRYITPRVITADLPLWNVFRYVIFWLVGGVIVGAAVALLRR